MKLRANWVQFAPKVCFRRVLIFKVPTHGEEKTDAMIVFSPRNEGKRSLDSVDQSDISFGRIVLRGGEFAGISDSNARMAARIPRY